MSKREKLFCLNYAMLRNGSEAAARSGYTLSPKSASVKLLARKEIADEIAAVSARFKPVQTEA
ncbi:MAG: hypothetical protein IJN81_01310, partial [Clostridia bacterium]|nr:hypothetical protein [Clostridia bacterium]